MENFEILVSGMDRANSTNDCWRLEPKTGRELV